MNRRQFVTSLFGAAGALLVMPRLEALVRPYDLAVEMPLNDPGFGLVYDLTLEEFRRLFDQTYRGYLGQDYLRERQPRDVRIGSELLSGHVVRHQWNVGYASSELAGDHGRYLSAAAGALAIVAAQAGCGELAAPPVPVGIIYAHALGPIRMVAMHDTATGDVFYRFDVLGAETEDAQAAAERVRQRGLKVRIKERLRVGYGPVLRLPA